MGLQRALPEFQELGAEVYAITADAPEMAVRAIQEWKLTFVVIVDRDRDAIRRYGVLNPGEAQSLPATFVIDRAGIVRYRHVGRAAADRPEVREVLEAVRSAAGASRP